MNGLAGKTSGSLKISGRVIADIAESAAAEIKGVSVTEENRLEMSDDIPFIGSIFSPVRVRVSSDAVAIDVSVVTEAGYKAYEVAKLVQQNVKSAVQNMTGIAVSKVNVRIIGIKQ